MLEKAPNPPQMLTVNSKELSYPIHGKARTSIINSPR